MSAGLSTRDLHSQLRDLQAAVGANDVAARRQLVDEIQKLGEEEKHYRELEAARAAYTRTAAVLTKAYTAHAAAAADHQAADLAVRKSVV